MNTADLGGPPVQMNGEQMNGHDADDPAALSVAGPTSRRGIYVSDADGEFVPWLVSIAEDQRRRHPGRLVTLSGLAREALLLARQSKELDEKLRR